MLEHIIAVLRYCCLLHLEATSFLHKLVCAENKCTSEIFAMKITNKTMVGKILFKPIVRLVDNYT